MKKITHNHHLARRMTASLLGRGFTVDRILSLHCQLDRPPVTEYLQAAGLSNRGRRGPLFVGILSPAR